MAQIMAIDTPFAAYCISLWNLTKLTKYSGLVWETLYLFNNCSNWYSLKTLNYLWGSTRSRRIFLNSVFVQVSSLFLVLRKLNKSCSLYSFLPSF